MSPPQGPAGSEGNQLGPSTWSFITNLIGGRSTETGPVLSSQVSDSGGGTVTAPPSPILHRRGSGQLGGSRRFLRRDTSGIFGETGMKDTWGPAPVSVGSDEDSEDARSAEGLRRRRSVGAEALATPQVRSMRLIGGANPRYKWEQYFKTKEELAKMKKPLRQYYKRNNYLISQYIYIDRLLNSSMPHDLLQEYGTPAVPATIEEESSPTSGPPNANGASAAPRRVKRTAQNIYRLPDEGTPLLPTSSDDDGDALARKARDLEAYLEGNEAVASSTRIVRVAIGVNAAANAALLAAKIAVTAMSSSLSILASLVDAALDFLSTAIVWATARLVAREDGTAYPVGRRPLEPLGVLVFAVIMMTAFTQVGVAALQRLTSAPPHMLVSLDLPSTLIMLSTILLKGACWFWSRGIANSAIQALAQDALTDVLFNSFSLLFPLIGTAMRAWWLDPLGGLFLAVLVIALWSRTAAAHLRQLSGCAASRDTRSLLLYLTMRFAGRIQKITALRAWHAGDGILVEVDVVLEEGTRLRDSHDLTESLQYVLESVPGVERAWVHADYRAGNLSGHVAREE